MDRTSALTLFALTGLLLVLGAVAWLVPSPLDDYRVFYQTAPGGDIVASLEQPPPPMADMLIAAVIEGSRTAFPLVAGLTGVCGLVLFLLGGRRDDPLWMRVGAVFGPLVVATTCAATVTTPPDVVTMWLMNALLLAVCVPVASGLLAALTWVGRRRAHLENSDL